MEKDADDVMKKKDEPELIRLLLMTQFLTLFFVTFQDAHGQEKGPREAAHERLYGLRSGGKEVDLKV